MSGGNRKILVSTSGAERVILISPPHLYSGVLTHTGGAARYLQKNREGTESGESCGKAKGRAPEFSSKSTPQGWSARGGCARDSLFWSSRHISSPSQPILSFPHHHSSSTPLHSLKIRSVSHISQLMYFYHESALNSPIKLQINLKLASCFILPLPFSVCSLNFE